MNRQVIHLELVERQFDIECDAYTTNDPDYLIIHSYGKLSYYNKDHVIAFHAKSKEVLQ
jgi:hypothetical protein